jgi:hypothetical protein
MASITLKHERSMKLEDFENEKLLLFIEKDRGRVKKKNLKYLLKMHNNTKVQSYFPGFIFGNSATVHSEKGR